MYTEQTYSIVCRVCIFASRADSLCNNILRSWLTLSCNIDNETNIYNKWLYLLYTGDSIAFSALTLLVGHQEEHLAR